MIRQSKRRQALETVFAVGVSISALTMAYAKDPVAASPTFEKPRLVIQITVDQLRGATTYNIDDPDCRLLTEGAVVCLSQAADGSWSGPRAAAAASYQIPRLAFSF